MRSIGIVRNPAKTHALAIAQTLCESARRLNIECLEMGSDIALCDCEKPPDILIVLGGDGTILRAVEYCAQRGIPILGINLGRIGFLTELEPENAQEMMLDLSRGNFSLEKRMLIQATLPDGTRMRALNDVVISRGSCARMIALDANTADAWIDHYVADGLIISTPTGSTAYSLSAGGPIVSPDVDCFILSPICAHSLQSRPIILSDQSTVCLRVNMREEREGMLVTIDGQQTFPIANQESVVLRRSAEDIAFVRFAHSQNFFTLLRSKLSDWSL